MQYRVIVVAGIVEWVFQAGSLAEGRKLAAAQRRKHARQGIKASCRVVQR